MRRATTAIALTLTLAIALVATARAPAASAQPGLWASSNGLLLFRSDRDGDPEVFTVDATGVGPANLTDNPGLWDSQAAWSPDGRRILFARSKRQGGRPDLYLMSSAGLMRQRLTSTPVPERDPAWSPDGTRIVFAARLSLSGPFRIFVAKGDGSARVQLTSQFSGEADRSPSWSPDGTRIAYVSDRDGGFPEIYVMNADGTGIKRLTSNTAIDGNPSWSPDGTRLVVERCCKTGSSDLVAIDVATRTETNLTNTASFMEFDPVWSPDGTKIAFSGFPVNEGNVDVWTMNADGTGVLRLTSDPGPDLSPDWQPLPTCTIRGTGDPDPTLVGTAGNDVICGLAGDDVVQAGLGQDLVLGGKGNDVLDGQFGADVLIGETGNDTLDGGPDYDLLDGDRGTDTCRKGSEGAFYLRCEL